MAGTALVTPDRWQVEADAVGAIGVIEDRLGALEFAALIPEGEELEQAVEPSRFTLLLGVPWLFAEDTTTPLILNVILLLRELFPRTATVIDRVTILRPDDAFIAAVRRAYQGRLQALPTAFQQDTLGGRLVAGGTLLLLREPTRFPSGSPSLEALPPAGVTLRMVDADRFEQNPAIRQAPLDADLVANFKQRFAHDRERSSLLRWLHEKGNAYVQSAAFPGSGDTAAVRLLAPRGPFVASNWMQLSTWDLALAFENSVAHDFHDLLEQLPSQGKLRARSWTGLRADILNQLQVFNARPHVAVLFAKHPGVDIAVDIRKGSSPPTVPFSWVFGEVGGAVTARLPGDPQKRANRVYLIDFGSFSTYTEFLQPPGDTAHVVEVNPIDTEMADELAAEWDAHEDWPQRDPSLRRAYLSGRVQIDIIESRDVALKNPQGAIALDLA